MFSQRKTKPSNNKYYIRQINGGYNAAIQGYPTDGSANVLSNCVGYANGRFNEIIASITGQEGCKYQLVCNAENFVEAAKNQGLTVQTTPVAGGIMVWQYGSLSGADGAGHVEVVEQVNSNGTIYTSGSSYGGAAFFNATRSNANGRWGMGAGFVYRGCIVNPAVSGQQTEFAKTFVTNLYKNVLGRKPDASGLAHWVKQLLSGVPAKTIVRGFFNSQEYLNKRTTNEQFINDLYKGYLNRKPDASGKKYWMNKLYTNGTRWSTMDGFGNSTEFKKILAKYKMK